MKYLTLTKKYLADWTPDNNSILWFLNIKEEYRNDYRFRKFNKLGEKALAYLNGEAEEIKVNKTVFDIEKSKFVYCESPVYYLTVNNIPIYFLVRTWKGKWITTSGIIVDEDLELFESYGYTVDDHLIK